jgi:3-phosphoshikimate 1-carboxyvinyltransferase
VEVAGGPLHGIHYRAPVPSAQVKGALLLAGLAAEGPTTIEEIAVTRDHTERALQALGAPVRIEAGSVTVEAFQHAGFEARCPGDPSSAAFLVAAAGITASAITIRDVGLNPSRIRFLEVMARQGIRTQVRVQREELGEPVGEIHVAAGAKLQPAQVPPQELPLVIDEVPVLALVAAHAAGESRFREAGELRVKESDRLGAIVRGVADLGGRAEADGDDLVLGGGGLAGGSTEAALDHRMAMALTIGALAADGPSEIGRMETAEVSFPGFVATLAEMGAQVEGLEP